VEQDAEISVPGAPKPQRSMKERVILNLVHSTFTSNMLSSRTCSLAEWLADSANK